MPKITLMRHGEYTARLANSALEEVLTEQGKATVREAAANLNTKPDIILASSAPRTEQTARIIAEALGVQFVVTSEVIKKAGNNGQIVKDLWRVVRAGLLESGMYNDVSASTILVVTHEPLVAAARRCGEQSPDSTRVHYGESVMIETNKWVNPMYDSDDPYTKAFESWLCELERGHTA